EQRIIRLINQFKKEQCWSGTISGRLTAKKLQDLYGALQNFSFKTEHIEEAMKNTVIYGGDLHSALDWLCLNLPDGKLTKLQDVKERALTFKQNNNRQAQREAGDRIKILQRGKYIILVYLSNGVNLLLWLVHCTLLNILSRQYSYVYIAAKNAPKDVRNFDYNARSWTGKSPKQFLIDWCRKNYPISPAPSYRKIPAGRFWKSSVRVHREKDGILEVCPTILTEDSMQAQHLASTLALWHLVRGQAIHQLLPPTYRTVWLEWSDAEKQKAEKRQTEKNKPREQFITRLLNTLKQQQPSRQTSSTVEDPEDSWENLVSDDFENISINKDKSDNLKISRNIYKNLQRSSQFRELLNERELLPVFQHKTRILETLRRHRVVVVAGETGSGKSTQIPQFLLEDLLSSDSPKCNIICTQPRRISAASLATRVCDELGCLEGPGGKNSLCGYQIRMESKVGESCRLLYCTTGILLRKLQQDQLLSTVSHVIVDEVHERSVHSDFLLIILKEIMQKRLDLNLVLMSATVDSGKFANYFAHCPIISIPGRLYPVEVFHLEDVVEATGYTLEQDSEYCQRFLEEEEEEIKVSVGGKGGKTFQHQVVHRHFCNAYLEDYSMRTRHATVYMNPNKINMELILEVLHFLDINAQYSALSGAVLIFLPGLAHIQQLHDHLTADKRFQDRRRYKVIALHSILSSQDQAAAFTVPPPGVRKIVLATNIAETGITIPDVVFVIDSGKTKENRYRESSQMSSLVETFVSKANALQRQGRAGRVQEGFCFRLYTKERFHSFIDYSVPEILRVPLEELCLHIMKCNHGSPEEFLSKALDPPQAQSIGNAMNLLKKIGACEINEAKLTPLGLHLAALPVNVKIGKMLIFGAIFGCLDPVATIAAAMTEKSPFVTPLSRKDEANLAKASMAIANSDHLTLYNAYLGWKNARHTSYRTEMAYCKQHFLSRTALLTMQDIKQELIRLVEIAGFSSVGVPKKNLSQQEISLLKAVLAAGLYDNVGKIKYTPSVDITDKIACSVETAQGKAHLHPSSVNKDLQSNGWLLFQEKVKYGKIYLRETTEISSFPILLFGGDILVQHHKRLLLVDGWIKFQAPVRTGIIFKELRALIDSVLTKKLEDPKLFLEDDQIIQTIVQLIQTEHTN
uniref:RNA helicase n=1 Tax=Callorhinchus milii TaxID=7868 RepID=A0A4W3K848_CALMI